MAARRRHDEAPRRPAVERQDLVVAEWKIRRQSPIGTQHGPVLEPKLGGARDRRKRSTLAVNHRRSLQGGDHAWRVHGRAKPRPRERARQPPAPGGAEVAVLDAPGVDAQSVLAPPPAGSVKLTVVPWPSTLSM
jgi:hypothetical protein